MDKNKVLSNFGEEDRSEVLNLYEKYILAMEKDITVFGNSFYPPNVWNYFKMNFETKDFKVEDCGFFQEAERRMICFNNIFNTPFPFKVIKINNMSKFNTLTHRDYLGSVLSLGIKRNKIGDLLVKDQSCFLAVCEDISEYILSNLTEVSGSPCRVKVLEEYETVPSAEFEEFTIMVQSLRIDSIVSKLTKLSRVRAQSLIEEGKVLLDYNRTRDKSSEVVCGQRITIRGFGKFIAGETIGNSKSGKIKINIKKYA